MLPPVSRDPRLRSWARSGADRFCAKTVVAWAVTGMLVVLLSGRTPDRLQAQELFYQAYEEGIKAFNAGDYPRAEGRFRRALELDARQSRQKRYYGMLFRPYIPEYYLGLIAIRQKQYQLGVDYLTRVEQAGLVRKGDKEYAALDTERLAAQNGLKPSSAVVAAGAPPATVPAASPPSTPPPASTQTTASNSRPASSSPPPSSVSGGGTTSGATSIDPGRSTPSAGVTAPPPTVVEPRTAAETTVGDLQANIARLITQREYDRAWEAAVRLNTPPGNAAVGQDLRKGIRSAIMRDIRGQLSRPNLAEANRLVETLTRLDPGAAEVAGLQRQMGDLRVLLSAEREALSHLLKGDYTETIRTATRLLDDKKESPRLLFYTACGYAALALLGNDDAAVQSQRARALFSRMTLPAGAFQKEERYISPQILRLLRSGPR